MKFVHFLFILVMGRWRLTNNVSLFGYGLPLVSKLSFLVFWLSNFRGPLSQPHFGQVWGWSPTLGKVGGLESSGTPECLELDSKGKNTSHWGVLGVIGKILKRRYRKCPRIGNSDICSPSYGQKKGRESNWQFVLNILASTPKCLLFCIPLRFLAIHFSFHYSTHNSFLFECLVTFQFGTCFFLDFVD